MQRNRIRLQMRKRSYQSQWDVALIDLDGTLYRGDRVIAGAPEFVVRLRNAGIRPVFFTNNAMRTPAQVVNKLAKLGIHADISEICTSAQAAASQIVHRIGTQKDVLYIGQAGVRQALEEAALTPVSMDEYAAQSQFPIRAAVVGLNPDVSYQHLSRFAIEVERLGWFVLTNPDCRIPDEMGWRAGNGALGAFIQVASGIEPDIAGKPSGSFVRFALERYGTSPARTVLIGDNIDTDIAAGLNAGVHTIWVASGVTKRREDTRQADEEVRSVNDLFLDM